MQGLVWHLPVLVRPQQQGGIERLNVDAVVAQPVWSFSRGALHGFGQALIF